MSQWQDTSLQASGINIHYSRTGGDKPVMILLHGFTDNGHSWLPLARTLETDYDIIMPDARGHGESTSGTAFSVDLLVADVVGIIQTLHLDHPILLGHSMGAHTAALVAKKYPDLLRGVVLEDPPWHLTEQTVSERHDGIFYKAWTDHLLTIRKLAPADRLMMAHQEHPAWNEDEYPAWVEARLQINMDVFKHGAIEAQRNWQIMVRGITIPVLLITGDITQGALTTSRCAHLVINSYPHGRRIHIDDAGHTIRSDQRDLFLQAVQAFLAELTVTQLSTGIEHKTEIS